MTALKASAKKKKGYLSEWCDKESFDYNVNVRCNK